MVTGEVKEIVSDAVKQLRESEDTLYCITNDGLSIIQTDCQGKKVTEIYKADYGMIDHTPVVLRSIVIPSELYRSGRYFGTRGEVTPSASTAS